METLILKPDTPEVKLKNIIGVIEDQAKLLKVTKTDNETIIEYDTLQRAGIDKLIRAQAKDYVKKGRGH